MEEIRIRDLNIKITKNHNVESKKSNENTISKFGSKIVAFITVIPLTLILTFLMALLFSYIGSKLPSKQISKLNISKIYR